MLPERPTYVLPHRGHWRNHLEMERGNGARSNKDVDHDRQSSCWWQHPTNRSQLTSLLICKAELVVPSAKGAPSAVLPSLGLPAGEPSQLWSPFLNSAWSGKQDPGISQLLSIDSIPTKPVSLPRDLGNCRGYHMAHLGREARNWPHSTTEKGWNWRLLLQIWIYQCEDYKESGRGA